jgi:predicted Zn-ribbon and HTH transcriptional regulator
MNYAKSPLLYYGGDRQMEPEIKGRCPRCSSIGTVMQDSGYLICDGKRYFFPYRFYHCQRHGIFVWRGNKHELFDLSKRMNQVSSIESLEPEVARRFGYMPTLTDYKIVEMKCPNCDSVWTQHIGFLVGNKETVRCSFCGFEISKEIAKKDHI